MKITIQGNLTPQETFELLTHVRTIDVRSGKNTTVIIDASAEALTADQLRDLIDRAFAVGSKDGTEYKLVSVTRKVEGQHGPDAG